MKKEHPNVDQFFADLRANTREVMSRDDYQSTLDQVYAELEANSKPVLRALHKIGIEVESVGSLPAAAYRSKYEAAIPILLEHLTKPYYDRNRWAIARALAVKEAEPAWNILKDEYVKADRNSEYKRGLAQALSVIALPNHLGDLICLLRDQAHGPSRLILIGALFRSRRMEAEKAIEELSSDADLHAEIMKFKRQRKKR